ncbi:MAG: hypothetical protein UY92_C0009G0044 [Candidatus Magasanikbacteria bacterium GW2011_GWA2_56_11]|uniref:Uncharacterized protein n=1 Tax=Candidatus Magasanikbacteria bacterium GW2011_GWA2_56_11 TaxID=1619044 RepID=A0A0G1YGC6_9BACT|nr:MAG: hypothetical protein UY92_C0009G0044 [Candidatus Magasanikbacteria bacterium GW2011_GWA2_56_11]
MRQLVSGTLIGTLESSEEKAVEEAILARRFGDGKISLRQIDEVLRRLQDQNRISPNDRRSLMRVFEKYCQA